MNRVEICNLALGHLGEAPITTIADDTTRARACALYYLPTRDAVLRSHRWNFIKARTRLALAWVALSGAAVTNQGGLIKITKTAHGRVTGDRVMVDGVEGATAANGSWFITKTGDDDFTLDTSEFSGTYTNDTGRFVLQPVFGWTYRYDLPADFLRALEVNDSEVGDWISEEWEIEGTALLTHAQAVNLVYIPRPAEEEEFTEPLFVEAFGVKLAIALTEKIRGSTGKTADLIQLYERITAPLARRVDANEGRRRKGMIPLNSRFVRARFS